MATKKAKKEEIDLNPTKVQNPFDHLKRSPGKFDQRVYREQELCSSNRVRFYKRLYTTQQQTQMNSYDKYIAELRRRATELKAQNEEYAYLRALRTALNKEKVKRERVPQTARRATPDAVRRQIELSRQIAESEMVPEGKVTEAAAEASKTQQTAAPTSTEQTSVPTCSKQTTGKPAATSKPLKEQPVTSTKLSTDQVPKQQETTADNANQPSVETTTVTSAPAEVVEPSPPVLVTEFPDSVTKVKSAPAKHRPRKPVVPRKCPVSPQRLATLESLSYEIMTNTLPIEKMKRILPDEKISIRDQWPLLSNYRKQTVLPSVKATKQKLTEDMGKLHTKLNEYFSCDNFPLWQYKYIPKDYPSRYRLLKAIETERISLPNLPKH